VKRPSDFAINGIRLRLRLFQWLVSPGFAQQNQSSCDGVVSDWTHHHVIFSGVPSRCNCTTCIMSFFHPTASPLTFPTAANATPTTNPGSKWDQRNHYRHVSGVAGASQIYYGNRQTNSAVQASQSALQ